MSMSSYESNKAMKPASGLGDNDDCGKKYKKAQQGDGFIGLATAAAASAAAVRWEVDEDHLLSYFLGRENDRAEESSSAMDVAADMERADTSPDIGSMIQPNRFPPASKSIRCSSSESNVVVPTTPAVHFYSGSNAAAVGQVNNTAGQTGMHGAEAVTDAVPFIAPQQCHQQQSHHSTSSFYHQQSPLTHRTNSSGSVHKVPSRTDTISSSSSSLSSMAAALALGETNRLLLMQQKMQARETPLAQATAATISVAQHCNSNRTTSPLTPIPMMGCSPLGHEMMMLPPPPRNPMQQRQEQQFITQQTKFIPEQPQLQPSGVPHPRPPWQDLHAKSHVNWIREMNANLQLQQREIQKYQQLTREEQQLQHQITQQQRSSFVTPIDSQNSQSQKSAVMQQPQIQVDVNGQTLSERTFPTTFLLQNIVGKSAAKQEEPVDPAVLAKKRQRRLARNRESARQSRRRKKEHLANLGKKVEGFHGQLERERRQNVNSMERGLREQRTEMIRRWVEEGREKEGMSASATGAAAVLAANGDNWEIPNLATVLQSTGSNSPVRRAATVHQYNALRQAFLSAQNQYVIWMMMQPDRFFTAAKVLWTPSLPSKQTKEQVAKGSKSGGSRTSSRQIGEEVINKEKNERNLVACEAFDAQRMWPFLCHHLMVTIDQEDRIFQAQQQAKKVYNLRRKRRDIETATDVTNHLRNAILFLSHSTANRNESLLLDVLTPSQATSYLDWFSRNKERCRAATKMQNVEVEEESTLSDVRKQLEEVLHIKTEVKSDFIETTLP